MSRGFVSFVHPLQSKLNIALPANILVTDTLICVLQIGTVVSLVSSREAHGFFAASARPRLRSRPTDLRVETPWSRATSSPDPTGLDRRARSPGCRGVVTPGDILDHPSESSPPLV